MRRIVRHPGVSTDLDGIVGYIAQDNVEAASRFVPAVELTLTGLAEWPGKGSPKHFDEPELAGIRSYSVDGFPNHLLYYRTDTNETLYLLAVLHGARNLPAALKRRINR